MAFSNYSDLQTEIADWLHRTDLAAKIPSFIQLGEAYLNRELRTVDMETRATAVTSTSSRYLGLPTSFLEIKSLYIQDTNVELLFVPPTKIRDYVVNETTVAAPTHFTTKDEIEFNCIPDDEYTLELHYLKKYDIAADNTNWLLTNYPSVYLMSSLVAAELYIVNDERLPIIKNLLREEIEIINDREQRKRGTHLARLTVDTSLLQSNYLI